MSINEYFKTATYVRSQDEIAIFEPARFAVPEEHCLFTYDEVVTLFENSSKIFDDIDHYGSSILITCGDEPMATIKNKRIEKELSLEQLAKETNLPINIVTDLENNAKRNLMIHYKPVCEFLGLNWKTIGAAVKVIV